MDNYIKPDIMSIYEAIDVYNEYYDNEIIKRFIEASEVIKSYREKYPKNVAKFYRSSKKYDYYIIPPTKCINEIYGGRLVFAMSGIDAIGYPKKKKYYVRNFNFQFSGYKWDEEKIKAVIDAKIEEDNNDK